MEQPKVTVITISKNSERYIAQTIESVLHQTYPNIEYVLVDGQSTDHTLEIIENYKPQFNGRMVCLSESDKGIYDAMNKGILMATGEIIGIINSDDWYENDAVKNIVNEYLKDKDLDWFHGNLNWINEKENTQNLSRPLYDLSHYTYYYWMPVFHPTVFLTRRAYQKVGLFSTEYKSAADFDLIFRCMKSGLKYKYIDKVIANFREGGFSKNYRRTFRESTMIKIRNGCNPFYGWFRYYEVTTKIALVNAIKNNRALWKMYQRYKKVKKENPLS